MKYINLWVRSNVYPVPSKSFKVWFWSIFFIIGFIFAGSLNHDLLAMGAY